MTSVSQIVSDTALFPPANLGTPEPIDWSQGATATTVRQAVNNRLANFQFVDREIKPTGVASFDELSKILPFSDSTAFFWKTTAYPAASILNSSGYTHADQVAFLIFVYARLLGFMGIYDKLESSMCADGSPTEFAWNFPTKNLNKTKPGEPSRQPAFLCEPLSPITGERLHGTDVLEYLASPEGNFGTIDVSEDSLAWRNEIEKFLYSTKAEGSLPDNRCYYLGMYVCPGGKVSPKAYFLPPFRAPGQAEANSRLFRRAPNFAPIKELLPRLDERLLVPYNKVEAFFESLEPELRPSLLSLATDIVPTSENRFKFYCYTGSSLTLRHLRDFFTLGGRITQPEFLKGVETFVTLWHCLFPEGNGTDTFDISDLMHVTNKDSTSRHKLGGVGYHIDLKAGDEDPVTKLYLPARNYFKSDAVVAERLQAFCDQVGYKDPLNQGRTNFVAEDFERAFPHRPIDERSGGWVYVSFALKRKGWEVGHYFSPENWFFFDKN